MNQGPLADKDMTNFAKEPTVNPWNSTKIHFVWTSRVSVLFYHPIKALVSSFLGTYGGWALNLAHNVALNSQNLLF